jgi:hypothetical protein
MGSSASTAYDATPPGNRSERSMGSSASTAYDATPPPGSRTDGTPAPAVPDASRPSENAAPPPLADSLPQEPGARRLSVRGVTRARLDIPADAVPLYLENGAGQRLCWRLGFGRGNPFVEDIADIDTKYVKGSALRVHVPVYGMYFAVKTFRSPSGFTLRRLLRAIETATYMAVGYHLLNDLRATASTGADVEERLRRMDMCSFALRRANLYVDLKYPALPAPPPDQSPPHGHPAYFHAPWGHPPRSPPGGRLTRKKHNTTPGKKRVS